MKKNTMMRVASVLMVAVLLSTSVISGTFAKYITSDSAKDTARVAKFGVVATIEGDLFGSSYADSANGNKVQAWSQNKATVSANDYATTAVVAPGTMGDKAMSFSVVGTPEVSTEVSFGRSLDANGADAKQYSAEIELVSGSYGVMVPYTGTVTTDTVANYYKKTDDTFAKAAAADVAGDLYELRDAATVSGSSYKPIVWLYKVGTATQETESRDLKAVFTAIKGQFDGKTFDPNQSNALSATLNWRWNFEDDTLPSTTAEAKPNTEIYSNADPADTILGDMIALANNALNTGSYVVKSNNAAGYDVVKTQSVKVVGDDSATNMVAVAYTGSDAPASAYNGDILDTGALSTNVCAVLGVAFDASLTVAQVD